MKQKTFTIESRIAAAAALAALMLLATRGAPAADLYHSPNDEGGPGAVVTVPTDGTPVVLNLYLAGGAAESAPQDKCTGAGTGDELCAYDLDIAATGGLRIDAFYSDADIVFHRTDSALRANGLDPYAPTTAPKPVGRLTVSATGPGELAVTGNHAVRSSFDVESIPFRTLATTGFDSDDDGLVDTADNCVSVDNPDQRDSDGDGIGSACDPDLNQDCTVNAADLGLLKALFHGNDDNADLNGDGAVNVIELGIMRADFFRDFTASNPSGVSNHCDGESQP